jgi:enhancing lycopene biosynthesis protein 2
MAIRKRKVWVLLAGSGLHDGTEVHEAALVQLALARLGASVAFCAPEVAQAHVIDHLRGDVSRAESRSVLIESARIARGPVESLATLDPASVEALVIPGGYGVVKNLCDYAFCAREAKLEKSVAALIEHTSKRGVPIASMCMANVLVARALGHRGVRLSLGWDAMLDADCAAWGARVVKSTAKLAVIDRDVRVASTSAFSGSSDISIVAEGIERTIRAALELG